MARKSSPEANLVDIMRFSLTWSDPKISQQDIKTMKVGLPTDQEFTNQLAIFFVNPNRTHENDDDMVVDSDETDE